MFEIVITEINPPLPGNSTMGNPTEVRIERYRQTVDAIELRKVIDAINYVKRVRNNKKKDAA